MSATSFQRHRRAVAYNYVHKALARSPERTKEVLLEYRLNPDDLTNLAHNSDVLNIADALAAEKLGEPELDTLEELNTMTTGDRAAVHSSDVRSDQFEDKLQHPSQETVGVGNMHDGPQAAEDLANVSDQRVIDNDGSLAAAAKEKAHEDSLKSGGLPATAPTSAPVATEQFTAEDGQPTDPAGANPGPETAVDRDRAAADLGRQQAHEDTLGRKGRAAIDKMERDELFKYAEAQSYKLTGITSRTSVDTIRRQVNEAEDKANG